MTVVFGLMSLGFFVFFISGLVSLSPVPIVFGAVFTVMCAAMLAFAASSVRPLVLSDDGLSVPTFLGRRRYGLRSIAGVALVRSTGKGAAWWLTIWTDDRRSHSTPMRLAAKLGANPEEELRTGRVAESRAAQAATSIYNRALTTQGVSGPVAHGVDAYMAEERYRGSRAIWSPDGTFRLLK